MIKKIYKFCQLGFYYLGIAMTFGCNHANKSHMEEPSGSGAGWEFINLEHSLGVNPVINRIKNKYPISLLCSNDEKLTPQRLGYTPTAIIMGNTGSGKTTLLNMVCKSNYATKGTGASVTRELFRENVSYGSHAFNIVDTPGMDSDEEVYKHAYLLKSAYEAMEYNAVFLVMPYQTRNGRIKQDFLEQTQFIKKYIDNVVLMISMCDMIDSDERLEAESNIVQLAKEVGVSKVIMYSKRSDPTDLANTMYTCISNNSKMAIEVTDKEFFLKFNIWAAEKDMSKAYNDFKERADALLKAYLNELKKSDIISQLNANDMTINNVIHGLGLNLAYMLDKEIRDFEEKYGLTMIDFNSYTAHIAMQKEKIKTMDKYIEQVRPIMPWDLMDASDIRNQIKQCPSCGQFLIKTEGCDGQTTCGDIPHGYDIPTTGRPWYTVIIQEVNGTLKFMFQEYKNMLIGKSYPVTRDQFLVSELKPGAELGLGGCGAQITWGALPLLDGQTLQNVISELRSTEDQAHRNLKKALKSKAKPKSDVEEMGILDENFQEHRKNYEKTIDRTIKSQTLNGDPS